jgi:hypothetical protein
MAARTRGLWLGPARLLLLWRDHVRLGPAAARGGVELRPAGAEDTVGSWAARIRSGLPPGNDGELILRRFRTRARTDLRRPQRGAVVRWTVARSSMASTGCGLDDFELCPAGRICARRRVVPRRPLSRRRASRVRPRQSCSLLPAPRGGGTKTQPDKWDLLVRTDEKRGRNGPYFNFNIIIIIIIIGRDYHIKEQENILHI